MSNKSEIFPLLYLLHVFKFEDLFFLLSLDVMSSNLRILFTPRTSSSMAIFGYLMGKKKFKLVMAMSNFSGGNGGCVLCVLCVLEHLQHPEPHTFAHTLAVV